MKKIVFLDEYSIAGRDLSKITSQGEYVAYTNTAKEDVVERLKGADIAITNKVVIDGDIMRQLPDLKLICVAATGMNNVDLETAKELGIVVKNAVGYSTISVAETTLASALALARNIVYFDEYFHDGRYSKADRAFCYDRLTFQISGKKWGIIGLGNIGREVARLASAFGCEVRYFSTSGAKREEAYPAVELYRFGALATQRAYTRSCGPSRASDDEAYITHYQRSTRWHHRRGSLGRGSRQWLGSSGCSRRILCRATPRVTSLQHQGPLPSACLATQRLVGS